MKKNNLRPDSVTGTTTKQERYEKKMAKYRANRARKEQMENEKANRQKNEHRNQSSSKKVKSMTYSMEVESLRSIFMKNARDFYNSGKSFDHYLFTRGEERFAVGNIVWGYEGIHPLFVRHSSLCWYIDGDCEIMRLWDDCLEEARIEMMQTGRCHFNYVVADSREEAVDKVIRAKFNGVA